MYNKVSSILLLQNFTHVKLVHFKPRNAFLGFRLRENGCLKPFR